jgi:hypothetical protein
MKTKIRKALAEHLPAEHADFYIEKINIGQLKEIVRKFQWKKTQGHFDDRRHSYFWLRAVLQSAINPKVPEKANHLPESEDWDSQLSRERTAWMRVKEHKLMPQVSKFFSQLSLDQQSRYRATGRSLLSYSHEQETFNFNPLLEMGTPEWIEESKRYERHMEEVELACALLILIKQCQKGTIKLTDLNEEKKRRMFELDFLVGKMKRT